MNAFPIRLHLSAAALLLTLSGCGGGGDSTTSTSGGTSSDSSGAGGLAAPNPPAGNWARLREFTLTPEVLRAPATGGEMLTLRLDYRMDFVSDTYLPTFFALGHLLPKGEALVAAEQQTNRLVVRVCGQLAYACGDPFTPLCTVSLGWSDIAKRRINCGSGDPALELSPGDYVFHASTCYTDPKGTRVCNTIARDFTLR